MKNILVIDPYASDEHSKYLQKIYEGMAVVKSYAKDLTRKEMANLGHEILKGKTIELQTMEENLHQRFDIFFISSMMITEKQISVKEIIEKYGNKDSVVVVMSSLGVFPKLGVDVVTHCINKDKISMKMFDSETKKELMSFLN